MGNNYEYGLGRGFHQKQDVWDVIKQSFREGSSLTKLIYINIGLYILIKVLALLGWILQVNNFELMIGDYLALPATTVKIITKPWSLFSYMFLHYDFFHILFNMLWLFWFGKMFLEIIGNARLIAVYILGGLTGAAFYIMAYNFFPVLESSKEFAIAIGASASVMAVVFAVAFYRPNHTVYLMFFGQVKLVHIAIVSVVIDVLSISSGNAGGHIAHLGGALYGYLYAVNYKKGHDIASFFTYFFNTIYNKIKRPKMKVKYGNCTASNMSDKHYNIRKKDEQERINIILDKISKSGYESLTKEEKEILFKSGRN